MTSKIVSRPIVRRVRIPTLLGACVAASILPGAIFADSFGEDSAHADRHAASAVDLASVSPAHALSPNASSIREVEYSVPAAQTQAQTKKRATFDMSHVERIRIRVWGNADVSGDHTIDPDSSLSFPRLGRIEIGTMTPAELEQMLAQKLSALTRTDVTVAIEVAKFRPYFIMGQVAEAGAIEWRPGLKVIQAISLARGVMRSSVEGGSTQVRTVANRQTRTQLTFALAQLARLKAEREGADAVATTERVKTLIKSVPESSRTALTTLVARQNTMLSEQRDMMETQLIGLRREREAAERELSAAQSQEKAVLGQLEITRAQLADIESLKDKQLVSKSRYLSQKSDLLSSEVRYAEAHSMVERARVRLSNIDQQLVMVPQQRRAALSERIDALEREVAQLELASGVRPGTADQEDVLKLKYHIARETAEGVQTIPASVFTEILPGDVLIVAEGQDAQPEAASEQSSLEGSDNAIDAADAAQRMIEDAAVDAPAILRRTSSSSSDAGSRSHY